MDTRVALYARLSRDRTGEETATSRQLEDCRAYAAARGWTIVGEYVDADVSAYRRNVPRPGYDAMVAELDAGRIDVIVAWRLDRLFRRVLDFERLWERCEAQGANIATARDGIDTTAAVVGELLPRLMAAFAQLESKSLSVREMRKHEETALKGGRSGGGHRPFGLSRDWTELVEPEATMIREAVSRILDGASMYGIAREWNAAGVKTPTGKAWSVQLLRNMLASPRLAGLREHRGAIVARGSWPAIVEPAQHERLRAILAARQKRGRPGTYLLSGLVVCGRCGAHMRGARRHRTGERMLGCMKENGSGNCGGTYVMAEPLEALVSEMALEAIDSPELRAELGREEEVNAEPALAAIRADEAALEELARDHYVNRVIGRAEFLAARDALHKRIEAARSGLRPRRPALPEIADVRGSWAAASLDGRKELVRAVIDHVSIGPGRPGATRFDPGRVEVAWRA